MKTIASLLTFFLALCLPLSLAAERPLTPTERIIRNHQKPMVNLDLDETSANEVIERLLERSGLHYTFIRSEEDRVISLKTKGDAHLVLETVAFAAGFNIHRDGNHWVIHPLPPEDVFY